MAARSTDNGTDWTYEGEALEQNPGYCPSADINDDGQGHANIITVGGITRLYTLQRPAGDNQGVGMLVHTLTAPTAPTRWPACPAPRRWASTPTPSPPPGQPCRHRRTAVPISVCTTGGRRLARAAGARAGSST